MIRSPSRTTNTLPSAVATSSWFTAPPLSRTPAAASRSSFASRASSAPSSKLAASTVPLDASMTALRTCDEISRRSFKASAAPTGSDANTGHTPGRADPEAAARAEVLRGPRHAPGGADRLLRAALVRAADVPRAGAAGPVRTGRRVELPRHRDQARAAGRAGHPDRPARPRGAAERGDARDHR